MKYTSLTGVFRDKIYRLIADLGKKVNTFYYIYGCKKSIKMENPCPHQGGTEMA